MKSDSVIPFVIVIALVVVSVGMTSSCEADCRNRGGTLIRMFSGGYECVRLQRVP